MIAFDDALALLGLHMPFTADQLRKQYYRCEKMRDAENDAEDARMMQKISAAKDLLENHVQNTPITFTDYWLDYFPPSPPPSFFDVQEAIMHSNAFLQALRIYPKSSSEHCAAM